MINKKTKEIIKTIKIILMLTVILFFFNIVFYIPINFLKTPGSIIESLIKIFLIIFIVITNISIIGAIFSIIKSDYIYFKNYYEK